MESVYCVRHQMLVLHGETVSQPLRHILHVSRLPLRHKTSNRTPNSSFLQSLQKCPVLVRRNRSACIGREGETLLPFSLFGSAVLPDHCVYFFFRRLEVLFISKSSLESRAIFLQDWIGGSGMKTERFRVWRLDAIQCRHSLLLTPLDAGAHCKTFNPDTQFDEFVRNHILQR